MEAFRREYPGEVMFVQAWGQEVEAFAEQRRGSAGKADLLFQGGEFFFCIKLGSPAFRAIRKIIEGSPAEMMFMGGIIPR